jgi:hypothetical protein
MRGIRDHNEGGGRDGDSEEGYRGREEGAKRT